MSIGDGGDDDGAVLMRCSWYTLISSQRCGSREMRLWSMRLRSAISRGMAVVDEEKVLHRMASCMYIINNKIYLPCPISTSRLQKLSSLHWVILLLCR
jgi:hypothetical protein